MRLFAQLLVTAVALLLTTLPATAAGLATATPEEVGFSSSRLARITDALRADVERGRIPGAVVVVARKGREGARVLGRKTVEYMTADHLGPAITGAGEYLPGPGYGFGLGFAVRRETGVANHTGSAGDYTWGGAFGTGFWIDPKEQLVVVWMTQTTGSIRGQLRQMLKSTVLQAITD